MRHHGQCSQACRWLDWILVLGRKTSRQSHINVPVTQYSTENSFSVLASTSDQTPADNPQTAPTPKLTTQQPCTLLAQPSAAAMLSTSYVSLLNRRMLSWTRLSPAPNRRAWPLPGQTRTCPNGVPLMPTTGSPDQKILSCRDAATLLMPLDRDSSVPPNNSQCQEATFLLLQHTKYGCTSTMHPPLYRQPLIQVPTGITSVNLTNARQTCPFCDHLPSVLV